MEAVGDLIDGALNRGHQAAVAFRVMQLRMMFRLSTSVVEDEGIRLTVRVWVALLDYMIHQEVEIRRSQNMGEYLTAGECGERIAIEIGGWPGHTVMWECCDFDDNAINGWPDGEGEPDD